MTIDEEIEELIEELNKLNEELKLINKQLLDKKKMTNNRFKELKAAEALVLKEITDINLDIEELNQEKDSSK